MLLRLLYSVYADYIRMNIKISEVFFMAKTANQERHLIIRFWSSRLVFQNVSRILPFVVIAIHKSDWLLFQGLLKLVDVHRSLGIPQFVGQQYSGSFSGVLYVARSCDIGLKQTERQTNSRIILSFLLALVPQGAILSF